MCMIRTLLQSILLFTFALCHQIVWPLFGIAHASPGSLVTLNSSIEAPPQFWRRAAYIFCIHYNDLAWLKDSRIVSCSDRLLIPIA